MKIGILTYHFVYNFGANLQVLSTVEYLKNNGYEPIVINWIPEDLEKRYTKDISPIQAEVHKIFRQENLPCTEICRNDADIVKSIQTHDIKAIIIGSDAVLQHRSLISRTHLRKKGIQITKIESDSQYPNPFWGSFADQLKSKIPLAIMSASSQNTNYFHIRGRLRRKISSSLKNFKLITVRDSWTGKMIKYLSNGAIDPLITPDPVFAFNQNVKNQYTEKEIREKFNLVGPYLLISFRTRKIVTREWLQSFQALAEKNNFQCVSLTVPEGFVIDDPFNKKIPIPLDPKEWYGLIKFSSGYIGENMHPVVVSLHNSVPFFSFDSYGIVKFKYFVTENSSKIYDLLSLAGFIRNRTGTLGRAYKCPSPEAVLQRIIEFDQLKCNNFSIQQQERYFRMMDALINIFQNKQ